jgi:hypothetical protein
MATVSSHGIRSGLILIIVATLSFGSLPAVDPGTVHVTPELKSESNAKQLVFACKVYAIDNNGNYPPSLDALFPTYLQDRAVLASPLKPGEPLGYKYTPGLTDTSPSTIILLEDKFAPTLKHVRIVVYTDDKAEILKIK